MRDRSSGGATGALRRWQPEAWEGRLRRLGTAAFRVGVAVARALGVLPGSRGRSGFLIVALSGHVGDTVMLMPLIEALRERFPAEPIDCAVDAAAAPLLRMLPEVRSVYGLRFSPGPLEELGASRRRVAEVVREFWREMRAARPAVCLVPRWGDDLFRSAYLALLTGAPRRIGFASDVGAPRYRTATYRDGLLTEAVRGGSGMHEPMRFLHLLTAAGLAGDGAVLPRSEDRVPGLMRIAERGDWAAIARRFGIGEGQRFGVIAPGTTQPKKIWPVDRWVEVVRSLQAWGLEVVVLSGRQDAGLARELHEACGGTTRLAAGVTSLPESVTLLSRATAFAGSDSGPGHLAGALGVPCAILFIGAKGVDADDPFSPERNRPMGPYVGTCQPGRAVTPCVGACGADEAHCILTISVRDVTETLQAAIERRELAEGRREPLAFERTGA